MSLMDVWLGSILVGVGLSCVYAALLGPLWLWAAGATLTFIGIFAGIATEVRAARQRGGL